MMYTDLYLLPLLWQSRYRQKTDLNYQDGSPTPCDILLITVYLSAYLRKIIFPLFIYLVSFYFVIMKSHNTFQDLLYNRGSTQMSTSIYISIKEDN